MISRKLSLLFAAGAFLLLSGLSSQTFACSCIAAGPPCQSYWGAEKIFSGVVVSSSETEIDDNGDKMPRMLFRFKVDEAFRGVSSSQIDIFTGFGGGDCGYRFKIGERYLVYGHEYKQQVGTGICSRTRPLSEAKEDLAFMRGLSTAPSGGSIFGSAQQYRINKDSGAYDEVGPITRATIVASSEAVRIETATDDDGKYRFSGLPPGKYSVHATLPNKLSPPKDETIEIHDQGCAEINYRAVIDGRIIGKLVDAQGRSPGIKTIDLLPVMSGGKNERSIWAISEPDGSFEFKNLPAGQYLMVINLTDAPSKDLPYQTTFYPSSPDEAGARIFTLEEGQHIANVEFRLPPPLVERKITGTVAWPDGRPAAKAEVGLEDIKLERSGGPSVKTDASGKFELSGYEGVHYRIRATIPEDPNWKSESGEAVTLLVTEWVPVVPSENAQSVQLVFDTVQKGPKATKQVLRPRKPR